MGGCPRSFFQGLPISRGTSSVFATRAGARRTVFSSSFSFLVFSIARGAQFVLASAELGCGQKHWQRRRRCGEQGPFSCFPLSSRGTMPDSGANPIENSNLFFRLSEKLRRSSEVLRVVSVR